MRNGGIYHIPVQWLHTTVNHRTVQCVRPAAKIFTDFTSIDFGTAKSSRRCTAWYGKPAFCTLLYACFACQLPIRRQILHAAVNCFTVRTSKMVFENGIKNSRTECTACTAILKSGSHFLARQRIDHLNAHKSPHPLAADVDIVGGLYIVKPLILCKLGAGAVGRHGLLCVIVAPWKKSCSIPLICGTNTAS